MKGITRKVKKQYLYNYSGDSAYNTSSEEKRK